MAQRRLISPPPCRRAERIAREIGLLRRLTSPSPKQVGLNAHETKIRLEATLKGCIGLLREPSPQDAWSWVVYLNYLLDLYTAFSAKAPKAVYNLNTKTNGLS